MHPVVIKVGFRGAMGDLHPADRLLIATAISSAEAAAADRLATSQDAEATAADRQATGQDAGATAQDRTATAADRVATGQNAEATAADRQATGQDAGATAQDRTATAADRVATGQNAEATAADRQATAQDVGATAQDRTATAADRVATGRDAEATAADRAAAAESAEAAIMAAGNGIMWDPGKPIPFGWVQAGSLVPLGIPFDIVAPRPRIRVTNGQITGFERDGVEYVEVLLTQVSSFEVEGVAVPWHNLDWSAGGANGGRVGTPTSPAPGGGAAGGYRRKRGLPLVPGSYRFTPGAGAPPVTATAGGNHGSDSLLETPDGDETLIGGAKGASLGTGNTEGGNGGSGGGGRGNSGGSNGTRGFAVAGQGHDGGDGYSSPNNDRAAGGGGGAGGPGGNGQPNDPGDGGEGVFLDHIASPRWVCRGARGCAMTDTDASPNMSFGDGSRGSVANTVGAGGNAFLFLVVRAEHAEVIAA